MDRRKIDASDDCFNFLADLFQDVVDNLVDADRLGLPLKIQHDAVAKHRVGNASQVVFANVKPSIEYGVDFGAKD